MFPRGSKYVNDEYLAQTILIMSYIEIHLDPQLRALWSLLVGIWGILKGSWGVLAESSLYWYLEPLGFACLQQSAVLQAKSCSLKTQASSQVPEDHPTFDGSETL